MAFAMICGKLIAIVLFVVVAVVTAVTEPPRCSGRYEVYMTCGSACPDTCDSILEDPPRACIMMCVEGCFCRKGYVRNRWGACIRRNQCPCKGPNEIFACGSACQTTCENLGEPCPIINIKCNDDCYCRDGYARDSKGKCIPVELCPPKSKAKRQSHHCH